MSDKEYAEYADRSDQELDALVAQFRTKNVQNYVAKPAPGWDVHGIWHCFGTHQRTGYATHAMALHWVLSEALQIQTEMTPHRHVDVDVDRFPPDRYDLYMKWMKSPVGHPHIYFCSFPPEMAAEMQGLSANLIPYCAFEGTRVSQFGRDLCASDAFREVWVVSPFVKSAMTAAGVAPERVRVVRPVLCGGPWTMLPEEDLRRAKNGPVTMEDPYEFAVLGTWQKRKGMHDLVRAYFGAFKREEPVKLTIRTSPFTREFTIRQFKDFLTKEIAEIAREFGDEDFPVSKKMPRLQLLLGTDANDQELIEWLASVDCYANPSFGEGLGIPHIWAKANGVPMVSTGYGAVGQLLLDEMVQATGGSYDTFVEHKLAPVDPEICRVALMFDRKTEWGVYEPAAFGEAMRMAVESGRRLDWEGAVYVRQAFSPEACVPPIREALREILPEKVEEWHLG